MKKLLVLALAAMMAFGVTAMVGAAMPTPKEIPVKVTIAPFARILMDTTELHVNVGDPGPGSEQADKAPLHMSNVADFTIQANTRVKVDLSIDNIIANIKSYLNLDDTDIWTEGNNNWLISPNLVVTSGTTPNDGPWSDSGRNVTIDNITGAGSNDYNLRVETRWNVDHPQWWKIPVYDDYVGYVLMTVSEY